MNLKTLYISLVSKSGVETPEFFEAVALPRAPVQLNDWTRIVDPVKFVASHIATVKANKGSRTFLPHLERLLELKTILTHGKSKHAGKEDHVLFEVAA